MECPYLKCFYIYFLSFCCLVFCPCSSVAQDDSPKPAESANTLEVLIDKDNAKSDESLWKQGDPETDGAKEDVSLWGEDTAEKSGDAKASSLWGEEDSDSSMGGDFSDAEMEGPWRYGLTIWNKFSYDTKDDSEFEGDYNNHLRGIAHLEYRYSDDFYVKAAVQGDYFSYHYPSGWTDDSDFRIHDAYANISGSGYNIKIGNQIVRWGKIDGFSPLDNINPEDYRDGIAGRREERKVPTPMLNVEAYRGIFTFQAVYLPIFMKSEFDFTGTDWAWFGRIEEEIGSFQYNDPDFSPSLEDSQGGGRIAVTTHGIDLAASYLSKRNDTPSIGELFLPPGVVLNSFSIRDLPRIAQATQQAVQFVYDRTSIWGFEFETTFGDFGLRGDFAYDKCVPFLTTSLDRIESSVIEYVIGIDYNSATNAYINLQFGQTFIQDWDDRIASSEETTNAISGTVSKELYNGNLKPEFRFFYDLDGNASIYNPKILIYYWDNISIDLGAEFYSGEDWSVIGTFKDNDNIYAIIEFKY